MECKFETDLTPEEIIAELIDTLWNVNLNSATAIVTPAAELIDTLWNVNLVETMIFLLCQRINRYIMECK